MKVEKVSANIRYSQDTGHGAWKVIELAPRPASANRTIRYRSTEPICSRPQGRSQYRHVHRRGDAGVGLIVATGIVDRSFLQQSFFDAYVFPQMSQRGPEVRPKGLLHAALAAGSQPQSETTRSHLGSTSTC